MFKKLLKNKKAQQTAEYALLISLVVAAVIAMQTYAQRTIQGRIRDASAYLTSQTSALGNTSQYEPYYSTSQYNVTRDDTTRDVDTRGARFDGSEGGVIQRTSASNRTRGTGGFQEATFEGYSDLYNAI